MSSRDLHKKLLTSCNFVHIYLVTEERFHSFLSGGHCKCEPEIKNEGVDEEGRPERVFIHQELAKRIKLPVHLSKKKRRKK